MFEVGHVMTTIQVRLRGDQVNGTTVAMHDIGARGPQPAAEPRPAAISAGCGPFFMPRPATARPQLFCRGCGPFVPAFVAYDT